MGVGLHWHRQLQGVQFLLAGRAALQVLGQQLVRFRAGEMLRVEREQVVNENTRQFHKDSLLFQVRSPQ